MSFELKILCKGEHYVLPFKSRNKAKEEAEKIGMTGFWTADEQYFYGPLQVTRIQLIEKK